MKNNDNKYNLPIINNGDIRVTNCTWQVSTSPSYDRDYVDRIDEHSWLCHRANKTERWCSNQQLTNQRLRSTMTNRHMNMQSKPLDLVEIRCETRDKNDLDENSFNSSKNSQVSINEYIHTVEHIDLVFVNILSSIEHNHNHVNMTVVKLCLWSQSSRCSSVSYRRQCSCHTDMSFVDIDSNYIRLSCFVLLVMINYL
jgi:hypothetical protein